MDPNLLQYISSAIFKQFILNRAFVTDSTFKARLDGETFDLDTENRYFELRISNFKPKEQLKDQYHLDLNVMIMITVKNTANILDMPGLAGKIASLAEKDIEVFDFSNVFLFCLRFKPPANIFPWGTVQITNVIKAQQTSVQLAYDADF